MFLRPMASPDGKLPQPLRVGAGLLANFSIDNRTTEADATLTVSNVSGGLIHQGVTLTSDVVYTLPEAAELLAAYPSMDISDAYSIVVNNSQAGAFDVVIAVGAGITAVGANNSLSVAPQSSRIFTLVKTSATTFDLY